MNNSYSKNSIDYFHNPPGCTVEQNVVLDQNLFSVQTSVADPIQFYTYPKETFDFEQRSAPPVDYTRGGSNTPVSFDPPDYSYSPQQARVNATRSRKTNSQANQANSNNLQPTLPPSKNQVVSGNWIRANESVTAIMPGEQDVTSHRWTTQNRYPAEQRDQPIAYRQTSQLAPFSQSLFQTPVDQMQNLVSTGRLLNSYLGQDFETFENQLPPPNTDKSMSRLQFEKVNPKLVWINGGYNHHNPPPRKTEQSGDVFKPVSALGGSVAFGSRNLYDPVVTNRIKMYAKSDLFNNRDGDYPQIPEIAREQPQGFVGYVQRDRYLNNLPATQEIDMRGWMPISQDLNPDLTKREEYTGEFCVRKNHISDEIVFGPNLINGVEAAGDFPMTLPETSRESQSLSYVNAPSRNTGNLITSEVGIPDTTRESQSQGYVNAPSRNTGNLVTSEVTLRTSLKPETTLPVNHSEMQNRGNLILSEISIRPALKTQMAELGLPVGHSALVVGNLTKQQDDLRPTLKTPATEATFGNTNFYAENAGSVLVSQASLKAAPLKTFNAESSFAPNTGAIPTAGSVIISEQTLRATLKMEDALRTPADPFLDIGNVVVAGWELRPTLKITTEDTLRVNPIGSDVSNFFIDENQELTRLPRRINMFEASYINPMAAEVGNTLPLQNATSQQYRGLQPQNYVTQVSRVPTGMGGTHCRSELDFTERSNRSRTKMMGVS